MQPRDHPKNEDEHQLLGKTRGILYTSKLTFKKQHDSIFALTLTLETYTCIATIFNQKIEKTFEQMQVFFHHRDFVKGAFPPPPQQQHPKRLPGGTTDRAATLQDGGGEAGRGVSFHDSVVRDFSMESQPAPGSIFVLAAYITQGCYMGLEYFAYIYP